MKASNTSWEQTLNTSFSEASRTFIIHSRVYRTRSTNPDNWGGLSASTIIASYTECQKQQTLVEVKLLEGGQTLNTWFSEVSRTFIIHSRVYRDRSTNPDNWGGLSASMIKLATPNFRLRKARFWQNLSLKK